MSKFHMLIIFLALHLSCTTEDPDTTLNERTLTKVELYNKVFYVNHQSEYSDHRSIRTTCPLWDAYWTSPKIGPCQYLVYQPETKDTEDYNIYKSDDGKVEIRGEGLDPDEGGNPRKFRIEEKEYFCKISATEVYDKNKQDLQSGLKVFFLTGQDVEAWENFDASQVFAFSFVQSRTCSGVFLE